MDVIIPAWQMLDREELLALVANMLESGVPRDFEENYLDAKWCVARDRENAIRGKESAAFNAMSNAHDAWKVRQTDKRYLAYAEARVAYERQRKAYKVAEKRSQTAWEALNAYWKRRP